MNPEEDNLAKYIQLGGFSQEEGFFETSAKVMISEILDRRHIVFIASRMDDFAGNDIRIEKYLGWFADIGINFENSSLIDQRVSVMEQSNLLKQASCVFLMGGDTLQQFEFLKKGNLIPLLKEEDFVVIGMSAGAINMAKTVVFPYNPERGKSLTYEGLGVVDFTVLPHFDLKTIDYIDAYILPLTFENTIYGLNENGVILHVNDKVEFFGEVFKLENNIVIQVSE